MLKCFYDERQSVPPDWHRHLLCPSAAKPAQVMQHWQQASSPIEIAAFPPASLEQICRAHDPQYVRAILAGRRENGMGDCDMHVAATLPWTCGSMIAAAQYAWRSGDNAVSPSSGFHHAGYQRAGAFCTFNGLIIAIMEILTQDPQTRIGILDLDQHYGDGSDELIQHFSLSEQVPHLSLGLLRRQPSPIKLGSLTWTRERLPELIHQTFNSCDLVLYQAGADSHVDDPLGGVFDTPAYLAREEIVFQSFRELKIPVAWNLAGGYQDDFTKVLNLHQITLDACVASRRSPA